MSAHSPQLQFVIGVPDSPRTEAKRVILVKGSWYEIHGSLRLPSNLNHALMFLGLSSFLFGIPLTFLSHGRIDIPIFLMICR